MMLLKEFVLTSHVSPASLAYGYVCHDCILAGVLGFQHFVAAGEGDLPIWRQPGVKSSQKPRA